MKTAERFICLIIALVFVFALSLNVFAAQEPIDTEKKASLRVRFLDGEKALSGAEFRLYMIADIDEDGNYIPKPGFEKFDISANGKDLEKWRELASTIEGYVFQEQIVPTDKALTDSEGIAYLPKEAKQLSCGLYLLVGMPHQQNGFTYFAESAIVQLPMPSDGGESYWNYDVVIKPKYTFIPDVGPDELISRKVLKIWDDKGFEHLRPKEIEVYLLCDGKFFGTAKLSRKNNWRYTWDGLEAGHRWTVTEKVPEGYTVKIEKEGITYVVTNKVIKGTTPPQKPVEPPKPIEPQKPAEPQLPQTGQLRWPVPVLFVTGSLFVVAGVIRRKNHEK